MKKKSVSLKNFNRLVTYPLTCAMTGFGFFWWYRLFDWNVFSAIFISLVATSYVTMAFKDSFTK